MSSAYTGVTNNTLQTATATNTISQSYSFPPPAQMAEEQQISYTMQRLHLSQNFVDVGALTDVRKFLTTTVFDKPVEGLQKCRDEGLPTSFLA